MFLVVVVVNGLSESMQAVSPVFLFVNLWIYFYIVNAAAILDGSLILLLLLLLLFTTP